MSIWQQQAPAYLCWRPFTLNAEAMLFSSVVYGAQLFGFVLTAMHLVMTWRRTRREPPAPQFDHNVSFSPLVQAAP